MNTIKKAVEHFLYKLNPKNDIWKATESDIKAITIITKFTEETLKKQYNDNQLFGKLYIYVLGKFMQYHNASIFGDLAQKELHKILDKDINLLIKEFTTIANDVEVFNRMKEAGISEKHPRTRTDAEIESEKGKFKMEWLENGVTEQEATTNLTTMINMALNEYYW